MRLFKPNIKKMEQKQDIEGLIRLFSTEKDYSFRDEACEALGRIGPRAENPLLMALGSQNEVVRRCASYALAELYKNEKRTSLPVLSLLAIYQSANDPEYIVRKNAAFSLRFIGGASSIPFLIRMLEDQYNDVRISAGYALHEIAVHIGNCPAFQPAYLPLLHMLRSDADDSCRQNAAWCLGALANPIAIEGLTTAIKDTHQPTRMNVVFALKYIADPATLPALVIALRDSSTSIVKVACEALGALDSPEAIPALEITEKDRDPEVAQAAKAALSVLKDHHPQTDAVPANAGSSPDYTKPSIAILDHILNTPLLKWEDGQFACFTDPSIDRDLNGQHRTALAWFRSQNFPVPYKMGDEFVAEYLYDMGLQAQQAGIVQEAWGGLHEALEKYLALKNSQKIAGSYYNLGRIYGVKNDLRLANALFQQAVYCTHANASPEKEAWALTYLGMSSSDLGQSLLAREAYERAQMLFQQTDPSQAQKITQLLSKLPPEPVEPVRLAPLVPKPPPSTNEAAIREAITRLRLRPREIEIIHPEKAEAMEFLKAHAGEALEPMLSALQGANDVSRTTLLYLLGETRTQAALKALVEALGHSDPSVRYEAITAIHSYPKEALQDNLTVVAIRSTASDSVTNIRDMAQKILERLGQGSPPLPESHWAEKASTWEQLSKAFIQSQIKQPAPDFKGLNERLKPFLSAEQHAAWIRVAQELEDSNPKLAIGCYVEALVNDPDPNSLAWQCLSGQYNPRLRVLEPSQPHSIITITELKGRYSVL